MNDKLIKIPHVNSTDLSLLHLNIRSLPAHTDELKNLLASIDCKFSVVGISETWLSDSYTNVDLDGYNFIQNCRHGRAGEGVGLYLDNSMVFKMRDDLSLDGLEHVESLFVEICRNKGKGIIVGIIYRPPSQNVDDFIQAVNTLTAKIAKEKKSCYLMGDFNLNLLNYQSHKQTYEFLDNNSNIFYVMYSNIF